MILNIHELSTKLFSIGSRAKITGGLSSQVLFALEGVQEELNEQEADYGTDWDEHEVRISAGKYEFQRKRPCVEARMNIEEENEAEGDESSNAKEDDISEYFILRYAGFFSRTHLLNCSTRAFTVHDSGSS